MTQSETLIREAVSLSGLSPETQDVLVEDLQLAVSSRLLETPFLAAHFPSEHRQLKQALEKDDIHKLEDILVRLRQNPTYEQGVITATRLVIRSWVKAVAPTLVLS